MLIQNDYNTETTIKRWFNHTKNKLHTRESKQRNNILTHLWSDVTSEALQMYIQTEWVH